MIDSISLRNFRSYDEAGFEFEPGVNIIVGPNASGKTNIVEALIMACNGKSFKGRDKDVLRHGEEWSRIDVFSDGNQRTVKIKENLDKTEKLIEVDGHKKSRMPAALSLPYVLFEPGHLLMLHGSPELRRDFIDELLSKTNETYASALRQYKRALAQRNSLLKTGRTDKDSLFVWNLRLSELGGVVADERQAAIKEVNRVIPKIYKKLSGLDNKISVVYRTDCKADNYATSMLKKLEDHIDKDIVRGFTSIGPHRDDLDFLIDGHLAKEVASRGEVRTIVLACKVFEYMHTKEKTGKQTTMLLDDVFSELDGARRRAVTEFLGKDQVFITTTDADVVVQHFLQTCHVIPLG